MKYLPLVIMVTFAYLIGNISPATLIGRFYGIDIKKAGSGNAGTTNVLRVLGTKAAICTLLIDVFKGFIAVYLHRADLIILGQCLHLLQWLSDISIQLYLNSREAKELQLF